jgi:hypothetical protein
MNMEISLFSQFTSLITRLSGSVREKNWPALETIVSELNQSGDKIVEIEKKRDDQYAKLKKAIGASDDMRLSDILSLLDTRDQTELSILTKRLRMEVLKVKVHSRGLSYYLQSVSHLLRSILEEAFPHTRGKIYSSSGKENVKSDSVRMINKEL